MKLLDSCLGLTALSFAFVAGAYCDTVYNNETFKEAMGFPLSTMYAAKQRCEEVAGKGNCIIIGGFMPRPGPVTLEPAEPLSQGTQL